MPIRNTHRVGDWLMIDEESGAVHYRSEMRKIWNGTYRRADQFETRQPQEFIKAKSDPRALREVRPEARFSTPDNLLLAQIGNSGLQTKCNGPAAHLYSVGTLGGDPGIGSMTVEGSAAAGPFIVR